MIVVLEATKPCDSLNQNAVSINSSLQLVFSFRYRDHWPCLYRHANWRSSLLVLTSLAQKYLFLGMPYMDMDMDMYMYRYMYIDETSRTWDHESPDVNVDRCGPLNVN